MPLPSAPFRSAAFQHAEVSRRSLVAIVGAVYSVWSDWAQLAVKVYAGVDEIQIVGLDGRIVVRARQPFGGKSIDYRHYLTELSHKPQAVRQVAQELMRDLGPPYDALWLKLCDEQGPKHAARTFAQVLRVIVEIGEPKARERVVRALELGEPILLALRPSVPTINVAIEALPERFRHIEVTAGSAADYDRLLGGVQ